MILTKLGPFCLASLWHVLNVRYQGLELAFEYYNFPLFVKLVVYDKKKIQMCLLNMSLISLVK